MINKGFILIIFFSLTSWSLCAQIAEDIITESGEIRTETEFIDDIVKKRMVIENRVLPYEPIREADIPWEKRIWRVIDVREKLNQPFLYPGEYFFDILVKGVQNGDINAFNDEKFGRIYAAEDVDNLLFTLDTVEIVDPDTYETTIKVTRNEFDPEDIKRFRLKEVWFFDEESGVLKVRILGIAPIRDVFDENTGDYKYALPMFWVYYPQARDLLSKHKVFNEFNDAAPMTWDGVFELRQFSSYITKASNVTDSRLVDLYPDSGFDMLMESDRIKMELFSFEHDLWSY